METPIFLAWFNDVYLPATAHLRAAGSPTVLVVDGFGAHVTNELVEAARANHVQVLQLTPHATHLQQPIDVVHAKPLKAHHLSAKRRWRSARRGALNEANTILCLCTEIGGNASAWDEAFSPQLCRKGFAKTGIFPLDAAAMAGLGCDSRAEQPDPVQGLDLLLLAMEDPHAANVASSLAFLSQDLRVPEAQPQTRAPGVAALVTADAAVEARRSKAAAKAAAEAEKTARAEERKRKREEKEDAARQKQARKEAARLATLANVDQAAIHAPGHSMAAQDARGRTGPTPTEVAGTCA